MIDFPIELSGKFITSHASDLWNGDGPSPATITVKIKAFSLPNSSQGLVANRTIGHGGKTAIGPVYRVSNESRLFG
jgi:hypothetical protein